MKKFFLTMLMLSVFGVLIVIAREPLIAHFAFIPDKLTKMPDQPLYGAEHIRFSSGEVQLHGLYFSAVVPSEKVVLYLHGNAGNLFDRVEALNELRLQGINVFLIDYRGYGLSKGNISEAGFYVDAESALDWLINIKGFNAKTITVLGRSIGSVAAMKLAVDYDVASVVLISPIANASAMAREMNMALISPFSYGALDNLLRAKSLKRPLLIMHGDKDIMVPITQGVSVFEAVPVSEEEKQFVTVKGATHHDVRTVYGSQYWPRIVSFIELHSPM